MCNLSKNHILLHYKYSQTSCCNFCCLHTNMSWQYAAGDIVSLTVMADLVLKGHDELIRLYLEVAAIVNYPFWSELVFLE